MRREDAVNICKQFWGDGAENAVDVLDRLGVLTLDKRTARQRAIDALNGARIGYPVVGQLQRQLTDLEATSIVTILEHAGLEIEEGKFRNTINWSDGRRR